MDVQGMLHSLNQRRVRESNPGHIGRRPAWETNAQPLHHPCSPREHFRVHVHVCDTTQRSMQLVLQQCNKIGRHFARKIAQCNGAFTRTMMSTK